MSLDKLHDLPEIVQQIILNSSALAPPPGTIPNLDHPPNQNALSLAVTTLCFSISTLAILIATYARYKRAKRPCYEDFFVLASYGLIVGVTYCLYEGQAGIGLFVHQWNVRVRDLAGAFYLVHVGSILYSVAIMLLKVAILLQWIRLFVPRETKGSFYWTSHLLLWMNVLLYSVIVITICASCKPFAKLWDPTLSGTCSADRGIIDIATAVTNLVSDVIILLLPQQIIWKLKLKTQRKIGIAFVFCVGILAIISAAFRMHASIRFFTSKDKTYQVSSAALWGIAELTCGVLIYCVPSIPGIIRDSRLFHKSFTAVELWMKSPLIQFRSWTSLKVRSKGGKAPQDSLSGSNQNDSIVSKSRDQAKAQLESHGSQAYDEYIHQFQPTRSQCIV
ncbi:hypothetical protein F5Y01DRAFT_322061 [Xylaria sp. FL0043]|nr:hypothetical protein F5Y01DRAFT_322061 [Xylaria sp. FL0043]